MKPYDYLVVGAGLFGASFARLMKEAGKKCLVIDRRGHLAGNCFTEEVEGIQVHRYGAHIFHTSNQEVWNFANRFAEFNHYINSPVANFKGELYNLPFNMNTFYQIWGVKTPAEAEEMIAAQRREAGIAEPRNLEEQAISLIGTDIYEKLVKCYTEKQWGKPCRELPSFIIRRLPVRMTFDNNYFSDRYQGIPVGGYTKMIEKMLEGIDVELNCDFFERYKDFKRVADRLVYTGKIDEYFDYRLGHLEYRSLEFKTRIEDTDNYQGVAVVNYTDSDVPYTRVIEHKHFEFGKQPKSVVTEEYPCEWTPGTDAYYPINDSKNSELYNKYRELADKERDVIFGGRLGDYKYYDMDKVIRSSLDRVRKEIL